MGVANRIRCVESCRGSRTEHSLLGSRAQGSLLMGIKRQGSRVMGGKVSVSDSQVSGRENNGGEDFLCKRLRIRERKGQSWHLGQLRVLCSSVHDSQDTEST